MNYRHHFHAGNFADVMKHALLGRLVAGLQRKEKGFLYLDTHAGRGSYDLTAAAQGDTLARQPEHPQGIGRLWGRPDLPEGLAEYVALVKQFDREQGNPGEAPRFYPGSPWIARLLARPQERLVLCFNLCHGIAGDVFFFWCQNNPFILKQLCASGSGARLFATSNGVGGH